MDCSLKLLFLQVPNSMVDTLTVSLIPQDTGRPTVRSAKAVIKNGNCYWETPVYETVKFVQDPKTGRIGARNYLFRISNGSAKAVVGELCINFADYMEATRPSAASFPLPSLNHDAVFHVLIQMVHKNIGQRPVEEREAKIEPTSKRLGDYLSFKESDDSTATVNSTGDGSFHKNDLPHVKPNASQCLSNVSESTVLSSESSYGLHAHQELELKENITHQEPTSFLLPPGRCFPPLKSLSSGTTPTKRAHKNFLWDSSMERPHMISDAEIEKLKGDLTVLSRQLEVSELEMQALRKQIVKQSKRAQDLSMEVASLKHERDGFKADFDKVEAFQNHLAEANDKNRLTFATVEANCESGMDDVNLCSPQQNLQESNMELIIADKDGEMRKRKDKERPIPHNESVSGIEEERSQEDNLHEFHIKTDFCGKKKADLEMQMEQLALDNEILKQKNHDLSCKLEQTRLQEGLRGQFEDSDSSSTIRELESRIACLEDELKQSKEKALCTENELQSQVKSMEEELDKCARIFEADLESIRVAKAEQEQRAAENLQEEFTRLSTQMVSIFNTNEKLVMKALTDASGFCLKKSNSEQSLISACDSYKAKILQLSDQINLKMDQMEKLLLEIEHWEKHEEKAFEDLSWETEILRDEIEKLQIYNNELSEKAKQGEKSRVELEQIKGSLRETEILLQMERTEKKNVEEKLERELRSMRDVNDEKETESASLRAQYEDMENSMFEARLEKERLGKGISMLKSELKREEEAYEELSNENQILRHEIEGLQTNNNERSEKMKAELEQIKILVQREHTEKKKIEQMFVSAKAETEKLGRELVGMRSLKDAKDIKVAVLGSDLEILRARYEDLKQLLFGDAFEKERLGKEVLVLMNDLKEEEETSEVLSKETQILRDEIERLKADNNGLCEKAKQGEKSRIEFERLKGSFMETEDTLALFKAEVEKLVKELCGLNKLKDGKEKEVSILGSDMEMLRAQYRDLKQLMFGDAFEKERLRKEAFMLMGDLKMEEETSKVLSKETQILRDEIERLKADNSGLCEKATQGEKSVTELERIKGSLMETEETLVLFKAEVEKLVKELCGINYLKDEKEIEVSVLESDLKMLRAQYEDLKKSLFGDAFEKEVLRTEVFMLKDDLEREEQASKVLSKEAGILREKIVRLQTDNNGLYEKGKQGEKSKTELEQIKGSLMETERLVKKKAEDVVVLLKGEVEKLVTELCGVNNLMDEKDMEVKILGSDLEMLRLHYEDLKHSLFEAEFEKEILRQQLFLSIEKEVKDSNIWPTEISGAEVSPNNKNSVHVSKDVSMPRELIKLLEGTGQEEGDEAVGTGTLREAKIDFSLITSGYDTRLSEEPKPSMIVAGTEGKHDDMSVLKERNRLMEEELREMQERYSRISLKFAEVEGERQRLVMALRRLKKADREPLHKPRRSQHK